MTSKLVTADGLGRRYGGRVALADASFAVAGGELLAVVGADGAGKTTLLQMLASILDPTEGRASVLGFDTVRDASAVTARIGYMSQGFTLYERLTVGENIAFAAAVRDVDPGTLAARRPALLAMAGLDPFLDRRAEHLSGGMRKKLALCTNLVHAPRVLLLDEPSLGVDPLSRRELWEMLLRFRTDGVAIVVATSYMDEAARCDRVAFLDAGRMLALDTPAELRRRAAGQVFDWPDPPADAESRLLAQAEVLNVQRLPRRVRFQTSSLAVAGTPPDPSVVAAAPQLEDLFAVLAPQNERRARASAPPGLAPRFDGPAIEVDGVTCTFGRFKAVDDVRLSIAPGEVFGFLGPNGAGKTTLIRALCGLQRIDGGRATVAGVDVARDAARLRTRIGYMSQRFSLYPDLTVAENLAFFARAYDVPREERPATRAWAVEAAGLDGVEGEMVADISGATRQRLALACAVLHAPAVVFLDEPTSGVDPLARHRFWRLVHALAARGLAAFVTTHYLEEAAYCNRLGLMYRGRLIGIGTAEALRAGFGTAPDAPIDELFTTAMEAARADSRMAA
jgi:ABC-2 type transport system ATP-binding protein